MSLKGLLTFVVLGAIFALAQGFATCSECVSGDYDCSQIYPKCSLNVDHLCYNNGVYYCAEPKPCPECLAPGFKCENKHPFCDKAVTTSLCYQGGELFCVEKIVPTTAAPPTTTVPPTTKPTTVPTTTKPTTVPTTTKPTTVPIPTTVNPLKKCLTPGLNSGCFLQCPPSWVPLIGKSCLEGTCCVFLVL